MSMETWKEEFYPVEAREVPFGEIPAAEHSLKKWLGLREEAMNRHGIEKDGNMIYGHDSSFLIDSDSCALCRQFIGPGCSRCPLAITIGDRCDGGYDSQYRAFRTGNNPEPMIAALTETLERLKNEE